MNKPIVVCSTGAHGIGKTTLNKHLKSLLEDAGFTVAVPNYGKDINTGMDFSSPERRSKALGFKLNQTVDFNSEYHIMLSNAMYDLETRQYAKDGNMDFILYDRGIFDILPYAMYSMDNGVMSFEEFKIIKHAIITHLKQYPIDVIFHPSILNHIEDDGVRPVDPQYQKDIDTNFQILFGWENTFQNAKHLDLPEQNLQDRVYKCFCYLTNINFQIHHQLEVEATIK